MLMITSSHSQEPRMYEAACASGAGAVSFGFAPASVFDFPPGPGSSCWHTEWNNRNRLSTTCDKKRLFALRVVCLFQLLHR